MTWPEPVRGPPLSRIAASAVAAAIAHMLAVVGDDEHAPAGHGLGDRLDQRHVALRSDAQHRCERRRYRLRVSDSRQLDDPDPILEFTREFSADLDGQAGLADSADAGQRDQPAAPAPVR